MPPNDGIAEMEPGPENPSSSASADTPAMLEVKNISKAFGATQALTNASIDLRAGEVHILLGENGAGKSTLAKIVAGLIPANSGEIIIDGRPVRVGSAQQARRLGIAIVFQELSLVPHLTVVDNLFLGAERANRPFSVLRRREEADRSAEILRLLELDIDPDALVGEMTIAQKQMLEIAKALLQEPRILIMDEPTSTLTEREKGFLFRMIAQLQKRDVAILYVTHHLREVFEIGSRVSAMRDGAVKVTSEVSERLTESELLEMLTGRQLSTTIRRSSCAGDGPLLEVKDLHTADGCKGVTLTVQPGEVVGVYGVVGCGREDLVRALVGNTVPRSGEIKFRGKSFRPRNPAQAARLGVGYLPMDRKEQGILAERPIRENLSLSNLAFFAKMGVIDGKLEKQDSQDLLERLRVHFGGMEDNIISLSGGNQQKVLFGRAVAFRPKLLVMEDPTAGIDMGAKFDLYEILRNLTEYGLSFLLLSSDLAETLLLCNRTYTMYQGRLNDEIESPSLEDEERVLANVLGRQGEGGAGAGHRVLTD